jgi:hypothetical protein
MVAPETCPPCCVPPVERPAVYAMSPAPVTHGTGPLLADVRGGEAPRRQNRFRGLERGRCGSREAPLSLAPADYWSASGSFAGASNTALQQSNCIRHAAGLRAQRSFLPRARPTAAAAVFNDGRRRLSYRLPIRKLDHLSHSQTLVSQSVSRKPECGRGGFWSEPRKIWS